MIGVGGASALTTVTVKRCGYAAKGFYGRDAIYPWHMSCAKARTILAGAINPHAQYVDLTRRGPPPATRAVLVDGRWWVCGGGLGFCFCGYRSARPNSRDRRRKLGRVPSQKSPPTTRARPGAPAVPEMLSICRTERHCAGDRSPNAGRSTNLTGGNPGGWATPGVVQSGRARAWNVGMLATD